MLLFISKCQPSQLRQQNIPTAIMQMGKTPTQQCPGYDTKPFK